MTTDSSAHRSELVSLRPTLKQQLKMVHQTLDTASDDAETGGTVEAKQAPEALAIVHAVTAARSILDALDPAASLDIRTRRLIEAAVRAGYVVEAVHTRLAELQTTDQIAADEEERRLSARALDEPLIDRADLKVEFSNTSVHRILLTVSAGGQVGWTCDTLDLVTPSSTSQLAVTTALSALVEALRQATPDPQSGVEP